MKLTPEVLIPRLGDVLIEQGLLTSEDLDHALFQQKELRKSGKLTLIGQLLVEMGLISRETLDQAITKQILNLQTALEDSNKNLELRVKQRTVELEIAYSKLSELSDLKSNFVSNISHELRTPLTHIQGYIELFLSGDDANLQDDVRDGLVVMKRSADRLNNLINDLITFSTSEIGSIQVQKRVFSLKRMVLKTISQFKAIAEIKGIVLKLDWHIDNLMLDADEERISWVINQLLDNAIKYTSEDGNVTLSVVKDLNDAVISVEDNGIGFEPSQIDDIFEPFHQLDGSSTRRQGGTGIGLALAKRILEAHNSEFIVRSALGKGSRFEFRLPIVQESV